jgi:hypothetical protein
MLFLQLRSVVWFFRGLKRDVFFVVHKPISVSLLDGMPEAPSLYAIRTHALTHEAEILFIATSAGNSRFHDFAFALGTLWPWPLRIISISHACHASRMVGPLPVLVPPWHTNRPVSLDTRIRGRFIA